MMWVIACNHLPLLLWRMESESREKFPDWFIAMIEPSDDVCKFLDAWRQQCLHSMRVSMSRTEPPPSA